jgi:hypothetical protein
MNNPIVQSVSMLIKYQTHWSAILLFEDKNIAIKRFIRCAKQADTTCFETSYNNIKDINTKNHIFQDLFSLSLYLLTLI